MLVYIEMLSICQYIYRCLFLYITLTYMNTGKSHRTFRDASGLLPGPPGKKCRKNNMLSTPIPVLLPATLPETCRDLPGKQVP